MDLRLSHLLPSRPASAFVGRAIGKGATYTLNAATLTVLKTTPHNEKFVAICTNIPGGSPI